MILGILFPTWPTPRELRRMTPATRGQWGLLAILQFAGMMLALTLVFFG